jgi:hypothetical protein
MCSHGPSLIPARRNALHVHDAADVRPSIDRERGIERAVRLGVDDLALDRAAFGRVGDFRQRDAAWLGELAMRGGLARARELESRLR